MTRCSTEKKKNAFPWIRGIRRPLFFSLFFVLWAAPAFAAGITIGPGAIVTVAGSPTLTTNGDWSNSGTFTAGSGTVVLSASSSSKTIGGSATTTFNNLTLDAGTDTFTLGVATIVSGALNITNGTLSQGASYNLTSGTVTVAAGGIWSNTGTGDAILSGNVANSGAITFDGSGAGCGGADAIAVTSTNTTPRNWTGSGTYTLRDLTVSYTTATNVQQALSSTPGTGNNWNVISNCGITVAGTCYSDEGTSAMVGTQTVRVKVNGAGTTYNANLSSGAYSIPNVIAGINDNVLIYLDTNGGEKAAAFTISNGVDITRDLYQNRFVIYQEVAQPSYQWIGNGDLGSYDNDDDTDIPFTSNDNHFQVNSGTKLIFASGTDFRASGPISTRPSSDGTDSVIEGDFTIQSSAVLDMNTHNLMIGGDYVNAGTFSYTAGQTTNFVATATGFTITHSGTGNFYDLTFDGGAGGWTLPSSYTVDNDLTVISGTLTSSSGTLTVSGSFVNRGTFTHNSGTLLMNAGAAYKLFASGGSSLNNLTFNSASGVWSLEDNTTVAGALTMTDGSLIGSANLTVAGAMTGAGSIALTGSSTNLYGLKSITGGSSSRHSCAVSNSGRVYCWGEASLGKLGNATTSPNVSSPVLVEDGEAVSSADSDGTYLINIKAVEGGDNHTCALANSGKVYCWGYVASGQVGDGQNSTNRTTPVRVHDGVAVSTADSDGTYLINIKAITTGELHSCALSNLGKTYCWGEAANGRLGDGQSTTDRTSPVLVEDGVAIGPDSDGTNLINVKAITAGGQQTCAITHSGRAYCWGGSSGGKLGNGTTTPDQPAPVFVVDGAATGEDTDGTNLINIRTIATGDEHTCAVSNSGKTYCWGPETQGELGNGATTGTQSSPILVQDGVATNPDSDGTNLVNVKTIVTGTHHTCAATYSGKTYCWGEGPWGRLGNGQECCEYNTPDRVHDGDAVSTADSDGTYLINIKALNANDNGTCALSNSGRTYCWGIPSQGQIGDGQTSTNRIAPELVLKGAVTEDQTLTLTGTGNFGGATAWQFYRGTFDGTTTATGAGGITMESVLTINNTKTLNAGSKTWTLSGSGTPFVKTGTFNDDTSTFNFTGTAATTVAAATYYNLGVGTTLDTTATTYTLASTTVTVDNNLTVGNAGSTGNDTLTAITNNTILDINNDVTITGKGTLVADDNQAFTVGGSWTMNTGGTFTHSSGTVTLNADGTATSKTIGGTASTTFGTLTLNAGTDTYTLGVNTSVATALNLTNGTLDQGASYNLTTGAVTVGASGIWYNIGTGDITLSGNVSNSGSVTLDGNGAGCGGTNDIAITGGGVARDWSGAGTFTLQDLTVSDTGTTMQLAQDSTEGSNNIWTITGDCGGVPTGFLTYF